MSKKKLTKGLAVALVASHLLTGVACNSKDNGRGNNKGDTTSISGETGSFDPSIMLEDVEFKECGDRAYPNTFDARSAYDLSNAVCNELQEFCDCSQIGWVSDNISPELLSAIFLCEGSWSFYPDGLISDNPTEYAGLGQASRLAIYEALERIIDKQSLIHNNIDVDIGNNEYYKIYKNYVLPNCKDGKVDYYSAVEKVFHDMEKQGENYLKLGACVSAMALNAIAGDNHSKLKDNCALIVFTYYCGIGNVNDCFSNKFLVVDGNNFTFDLNRLKLENFDSKNQYKKVLEGYIYTIKVLNTKKIMENSNVVEDDKRDVFNDVLEDIKNGNYKKYANIFDEYNIQVVGSLDLDSPIR